MQILCWLSAFFFLSSLNDEEGLGAWNKWLSILWRCTTISDLMINEQIRDREVRLIGANGEQLEIMSAEMRRNMQWKQAWIL